MVTIFLTLIWEHFMFIFIPSYLSHAVTLCVKNTYYPVHNMNWQRVHEKMCQSELLPLEIWTNVKKSPVLHNTYYLLIHLGVLSYIVLPFWVSLLKTSACTYWLIQLALICPLLPLYCGNFNKSFVCLFVLILCVCVFFFFSLISNYWRDRFEVDQYLVNCVSFT